MKIGNIELKNYAALAPMAGVADCAFRELCAEFGAAYTVTEMVSSKGIHFNSERSAELMELSPKERPSGIQIFGDDPKIMADAAVFAMRYKPDFWGFSMATSSRFEYNRQSMGIFAQDTLNLTDTLSIEGGGRYQRTWDENTTLVSPRRISDTYAADAALLFAPVEGLKSYVRFSRFFRNPFLDENPFRNNAAQKVLSPETGWSVNVGADYEFLDEFTVFADLFVSRTKHEILYDKFVWNNNVNAPNDIVREGFSVGAAWERDKVAGARLAYTFVDAEFDGGVYDGKDVPMVAESTAVASSRVWIWDECFIFGGCRFLSPRRPFSDFSNESRQIPSCTLFHIGVQYIPEASWLEGFRFCFEVDNLLDRHYADCATRSSNSRNAVYYPGAGRSYMFTIRYEF